MATKQNNNVEKVNKKAKKTTNEVELLNKSKNIALKKENIKEETIANKEETVPKEKEEKKKNTEQKPKNKIWKKLLITLVIILIMGISAVAFLFYGPYKGFRDWWITTAMTTMTHQYLATWFFSTETINTVLAQNRVEEIEGITDITLIKPEIEPEETYDNEYEKQILAKNLDKEEYNIYAQTEDYRIIEIEAKRYKGYLAVIYDPSRVKAVATNRVGISGQYLTTMVKENDAILGINGGGFVDENYKGNGSTPHGITITSGKVVSSNQYYGSGGLIGFNEDNQLILGRMTLNQAKNAKIRDAVTWGPYLIMNGQASKVFGNGGWGTAPRTAIGQRQDGIVLMLVIDGRRVSKPGADMNDLIEIMQNYGAFNAVNLDGGTSSAMVLGDKIINDPINSSGEHRTRYIATGFVLSK